LATGTTVDATAAVCSTGTRCQSY